MNVDSFFGSRWRVGIGEPSRVQGEVSCRLADHGLGQGAVGGNNLQQLVQKS